MLVSGFYYIYAHILSSFLLFWSIHEKVQPNPNTSAFNLFSIMNLNDLHNISYFEN